MLSVFNIVLLCTMIINTTQNRSHSSYPWFYNTCGFLLKNHPSLILQLITWYPSLDFFQRKKFTIYISNWNHTNILAAYVRWLLEQKRYTLLRWFWFMTWLVVSILKWNAIMWIHRKCLSHVEVITTHTDIQI